MISIYLGPVPHHLGSHFGFAKQFRGSLRRLSARSKSPPGQSSTTVTHCVLCAILSSPNSQNLNTQNLWISHLHMTLIWQAPHHLSLMKSHRNQATPLEGYWYLDGHTWVQQIRTSWHAFEKLLVRSGANRHPTTLQIETSQPSCIFWRKPVSDRSALVLLEFQTFHKIRTQRCIW